jgi:hypothetical protein
MLLVGRALSQCFAQDAGEAVRGLALAGLAVHMAAPAQRHFPEALTYLEDLVRTFCPVAGPAAGAGAPLPLPCGKKSKGQAGQAGAVRAAARTEGEGLTRRVAPGLLAFAAEGEALTKLSAARVRSPKTLPPHPIPLAPRP